jgi:uncharacterized protein YjiS (DUF1127 family)
VNQENKSWFPESIGPSPCAYCSQRKGAPTTFKGHDHDDAEQYFQPFCQIGRKAESDLSQGQIFSEIAGRLINNWIAVVIARRERQANLVILRKLSDRELSDMGLSRNQLGEGLPEAAKDRARLQASRRR